MKPMEIGLALVTAGILVKFILGGRADKQADVSALAKDAALIIDVRTPGEFSGGHIEGAINIPYDIVSRAIDTHEADRNRAIIVYCLSGSRSSVAKRSLMEVGYTNVVNGGSYRRMRKMLAPE